jgi:hypothetical protein
MTLATTKKSNPMPTLDAVIHQLCTIGGSTRLSRGLGLRYTPPAKEYGSTASIISLSRRAVPPSAAELQTVVSSLARVLNAPGAEFLVTGQGLVRRIWFLNTLRLPPLAVYQAIVWVKDDWISLGVHSDPDEVLAMGKRAAARLRYSANVRVVQYQVQKQEN